MVEFLTLFLVLATGPRSVDLAVAGPVAGPVPGPMPAAWDGPVGDGLVELFTRPTELAAGSWPVELVVLPPAAEVVVVREPAVQPRIDALAEREVGTTYGSVAHLGVGSEVRFLSPLAAPVARVASDRIYFSRAGPYLESTSAPEAVVGTLPGGSSGPYSAQGVTGDLLRLAHRIMTPSPRRLADAVAVAGMELHGTGRRRAVVLVVEEERPDQSLFGVSTVRSFLCDLQAPLVLWSVAETQPRPDADWGPGWGAPEWLGTPSWPFRGLENFAAAVGALRRRLEAQRIVYLAGRHLPRSIALGPQATGIRLAGRTDACGGGPP